MPADPINSGRQGDLEALKARHQKSGRWQAVKSELTRQKILEAAIKCFVNLGYARSTMAEIAKAAGLSRGAMVHHFSNKGELVKTAICYLHEKRLANFQALVAAIPDGEDRTKGAIDAYWKHITGDYGVAYFELVMASRTDRELEEIMLPLHHKGEPNWFGMVKRMLPEWEGTGALFDLAMDVSRYTLQGMYLHHILGRSEARQARMRAYLAQRIKDIHAAATAARSDDAVRYFLSGFDR